METTKKLAIIIPYRDRKIHLTQFLEILPQKIYATPENCPHFPYHIFVVEQANQTLFNRGKLLNVGFDLSQADYDYFCFHDVDMLPKEVDYTYCQEPTHLAAVSSQFADRGGIPYPTYIGGVFLCKKADFKQINGFSNGYMGWGGEDDDLLHRIVSNGLGWGRREGTFESQPHPHAMEGSKRHFLYYNALRYQKILQGHLKDSSGLTDLKYTVIDKQETNLYTHYKVDI